MSSDLKDARWGLAKNYAYLAGKTFEDYDYQGWQELLDLAQEELDDYGDVEYWAEQFRKQN